MIIITIIIIRQHTAATQHTAPLATCARLMILLQAETTSRFSLLFVWSCWRDTECNEPMRYAIGPLRVVCKFVRIGNSVSRLVLCAELFWLDVCCRNKEATLHGQLVSFASLCLLRHTRRLASGQCKVVAIAWPMHPSELIHRFQVACARIHFFWRHALGVLSFALIPTTCTTYN